MSGYLHGLADLVPVGQDLVQVLGTQGVSQRRLCQQLCGVGGVGDVGYRHARIVDAVVDHSIHGHRDTVPGQNLRGTLLGSPRTPSKGSHHSVKIDHISKDLNMN